MDGEEHIWVGGFNDTDAREVRVVWVVPAFWSIAAGKTIELTNHALLDFDETSAADIHTRLVFLFSVFTSHSLVLSVLALQIHELRETRLHLIRPIIHNVAFRVHAGSDTSALSSQVRRTAVLWEVKLAWVVVSES